MIFMMGKPSQSQPLITDRGLTAPETEEAVGKACSWLLFTCELLFGTSQGLLLVVTCHSHGVANVCYLDTVLSGRPLCDGHDLDSYDLGHMLCRCTFSVPESFSSHIFQESPEAKLQRGQFCCK